MKIERYEQRVLIPEDGKYLVNERERVISGRVYLGIRAPESDWREITAAEKAGLEARWAEETAGSEN